MCRLNLLCGLVVAGVTTLLAGCHAPAEPAGPTEMVMSVRNYDAFVDSTMSVLRRWEFPPDRVNRQLGIIVTEPATSAQWFEFWRIDSPGGYQTLESSLHNMRRVVTVNMDPVERSAETSSQPASDTDATAIEQLSDEAVARSGNLRVRVRVDKLRYSGVERQVTTASGAMALYSERTPTVYGQRGKHSRDPHWVPVGRDPLLECDLLKKIAAASESAEVQTPPAPEAPETPTTGPTSEAG